MIKIVSLKVKDNIEEQIQMLNNAKEQNNNELKSLYNKVDELSK